MTTEAAPRDTVQRIVQAATELFAVQNFEAVSIKTIAAKAAVNSALNSDYVGGKKQLYVAVLQQQAALFQDCIDRLQHESLTGLQRIWRLLDSQAAIHLQDNSSMRIIYRELLALFDEAKSEGSVRNDVDSYTASFTLFSLLAFYLVTYQYNPHESRMPGGDTKERIQGAFRSYLQLLLTGKEDLP